MLALTFLEGLQTYLTVNITILHEVNMFAKYCELLLVKKRGLLF